MMKLKHLVATAVSILALLVLLVAVGGCSSSGKSSDQAKTGTTPAPPVAKQEQAQKQQPAEAKATPAAPAPRVEKIKVALPRKTFGYLPLIVGVEKGFFKEQELDLEIVEMQASISVPALLNGEVDFGGSGSSAMRAAAQGAPLKAILFFYDKSTFNFVTQPSITSMADLKGKVIGVQSLGGSTDLAARIALKAGGIDPEKEATFIAVGAGSQPVAALQSKAIDATMLNVDEAARITADGQFKNLMFAGDLMPTPFSGFATTDKNIAERSDIVKRWLRAQVKSLIYTRDNPEQVIQLSVEQFALKPAEARIAVTESVKAIAKGAPGGASEQALKDLIETDIKGPLKLTEAVPISKVVDFKLLLEVQKEFK